MQQDHDTDLKYVIADAQKFVSAFAPVITQSASHIYLFPEWWNSMEDGRIRLGRLYGPCLERADWRDRHWSIPKSLY
jgi:hypothetical protein